MSTATMPTTAGTVIDVNFTDGETERFAVLENGRLLSFTDGDNWDVETIAEGASSWEYVAKVVA